MHVPQLPEFLWWDHNAYYHRWLLRQLPAGPARVLDVGCGAGALASRLAARAEQVDALDRAPHMTDRARSRWPQAANVRWITGDLLDAGLPLAPAGYDAVTAVASLHHMPLNPGLARLASLVRPGGVLVVVGLYRIAPADYPLEPVTVAANAAMGAALALRGRAGKPHDIDMPIASAQATLADIRAAARALTPGARIRRRLFWRYSLLWRRSPGLPI
jgi:SAM-dependent methyltransferase